MTSALLIDDLFLLHEVLFPAYVGFGEKTIFGTYAACVLLGLVVWRKVIKDTPFALLLGAGVFFALSIAVDFLQFKLQPYLGGWRILLEDGFKFLGIVTWHAYFASCCFMALVATFPGLGVVRVDPDRAEVTTGDAAIPAMMPDAVMPAARDGARPRGPRSTGRPKGGASTSR